MNWDDFCQPGIRKLGEGSDNTWMIQRQTRMNFFHIPSAYKSTSNTDFAVESIVWKDNPQDNNFWFFENCCTPLECSALQKFPKKHLLMLGLISARPFTFLIRSLWASVCETSENASRLVWNDVAKPHKRSSIISQPLLSFVPQEMNMQYVTNKICLIIGCPLHYAARANIWRRKKSYHEMFNFENWFLCQFSSNTRFSFGGGSLNTPKIGKRKKEFTNINLRGCKTQKTWRGGFSQTKQVSKFSFL